MEKKQTILEIVNFIGSIASITGISLLWLKGSENIRPLDIVFLSGLVSISFGFLFLGIAIVRSIYKRWVINQDWVWKIVFFALIIPLLGFSIWVIAVFILQVIEKTIKVIFTGF
jgi:hypothetical protein